MPRSQISAKLDDDQIRRLDEFAAQIAGRQTGMDCSRAAALRLVVAAGLRTLATDASEGKSR